VYIDVRVRLVTGITLIEGHPQRAADGGHMYNTVLYRASSSPWTSKAALYNTSLYCLVQ